MRTASIERNTFETKIKMSVNLDAQEPVEIDTGVGFFDHMLTLFARHSRLSLVVKVDGDLHVDSHHTVEDVGIVLGQAVKEALGTRPESTAMEPASCLWMRLLVWPVWTYQVAPIWFSMPVLTIQN